MSEQEELSPLAFRGLNPTREEHYLRALFAGPHIADLPPEPDEFDAWAGFSEPSIYTNDYEGSCAECEEENWRAGQNHVNGLRVRFSKEAVHAAYRAQTGGEGKRHDSGLNLGDTLDWHAKNAVADTDGKKHLGGPHGSLNVKDLATLSKACYYFHGLKLGIASGQLQRLTPDQVITGLGKESRVDHCVAAVGRKIINGARFWKIETWGFYLFLDEPSFANILFEAWVRSKDPDRFLPSGLTIEGWDEAEVLRQWAVFSGAPIEGGLRS